MSLGSGGGGELGLRVDDKGYSKGCYTGDCYNTGFIGELEVKRWDDRRMIIPQEGQRVPIL